MHVPVRMYNRNSLLGAMHVKSKRYLTVDLEKQLFQFHRSRDPKDHKDKSHEIHFNKITNIETDVSHAKSHRYYMIVHTAEGQLKFKFKNAHDFHTVADALTQVTHNSKPIHQSSAEYKQFTTYYLADRGHYHGVPNPINHQVAGQGVNTTGVVTTTTTTGTVPVTGVTTTEHATIHHTEGVHHTGAHGAQVTTYPKAATTHEVHHIQHQQAGAVSHIDANPAYAAIPAPTVYDSTTRVENNTEGKQTTVYRRDNSVSSISSDSDNEYKYEDEEKDRVKKAKKHAKEVEKQAKKEAKEAEKHAKETEKHIKEETKAHEKAVKEHEKEAKHEAKEAEKHAKEAAKEAEKHAKEEQKHAEEAIKKASKEAHDDIKYSTNTAKEGIVDSNKYADKKIDEAAKNAEKHMKD